MDDKIIEIFYLVDEFCKELEKTIEKQSVDQNNGKKRRKRAFKMSDSEVITILILFHLKNYRCLKHFYIAHAFCECL